jgi:hypothetical protein
MALRGTSLFLSLNTVLFIVLKIYIYTHIHCALYFASSYISHSYTYKSTKVVSLVMFGRWFGCVLLHCGGGLRSQSDRDEVESS